MKKYELLTVCQNNENGAIPMCSDIGLSPNVYACIKNYTEAEYLEIRKQADEYILIKTGITDDSAFKGTMPDNPYADSDPFDERRIKDNMMIVKDGKFFGCCMEGKYREYSNKHGNTEYESFICVKDDGRAHKTFIYINVHVLGTKDIHEEIRDSITYKLERKK